jgi:hypothetical protein
MGVRSVPFVNHCRKTQTEKKTCLVSKIKLNQILWYIIVNIIIW